MKVGPLKGFKSGSDITFLVGEEGVGQDKTK